ncbi:MAG TPA: polyphosphate kinase 1 [Rubricoccaceae bacterium]|nr:polyphosphate kinase 1 [Rubricoccaceae bacterium]
MAQTPPFFDRELSWLAFNGRVLQEAADPRVPLAERLGFLAIFSSNLDEFFRVRVAALRALLRLKKKQQKQLDFNPAKLLRTIYRTVGAQQEHFGHLFRAEILPGLEAHGVALRDGRTLTAAQREFVRAYFRDQVVPHLHPALLPHPRPGETPPPPFLENARLYLVAELWPHEAGVDLLADDPSIALVEVPSPPVPRFVEVPVEEGPRVVLFLDDVIRLGLPDLFPGWEVGDAYAVKLTRDAELNVEDEFSGNLVEKIRDGVKRRKEGVPSRLLYDPRMPYALVSMLKNGLGLEDEDLFSGGRYHHLTDLHGFPRPDEPALHNEPLPPLPHPVLSEAPSLIAAVGVGDHLLHLPYHRFDEVVRFLDEAAADPQVEEMAATLYRVAKDSRIVRALIAAAEAGKRVTAFVEVKARFDEENNLEQAARMEQAGVHVRYSLPGLKVHAKLLLVARREGAFVRDYAVLSTGNFNEKTARIYADHVLFTADRRLTDDVRWVFAHLTDAAETPESTHLLVAPFTLRSGLYERIEREIAHAEKGRPACIRLKVNSLEDDEIIERLYDASRAGVEVQAIIRGICRLVPGHEKWSPTVEARSIVDRFLEHARVFVFHDNGEDHLYLASADWMRRNLSRRIEVAFPIYDPRLRAELFEILDLQWADDAKARVLDADQANAYYRPSPPRGVRAQTDTYALVRRWAEEVRAGGRDGVDGQPPSAGVGVPAAEGTTAPAA